MKPLRNVSLELSAKPFHRADDAFVRPLMAEVFRRWRSLLAEAEQVSVLWWLGDGTEILEYDGDAARPIEWAMWLGFAHKVYDVDEKDDPQRESIVGLPRLYRPAPARIAYGDIRRIVAAMKMAAREALGVPLRVGCAFDPGAEFCRSPFRYERHPELLMGSVMRCIDTTARLRADPARFAGFPDGVPEGTPFGTFFGRQARRYMEDMGFDYIWFSNSFGFGRSPYATGGSGQFFDGERYRPEGNRAVRDAVLEFWRRFRAECPGPCIECRGTDFTTGMNLVNHATPYATLYAGGFHITPPPNTPWPALTGNHGIALAGYLSQIGGYRGDVFPFRQYVSDPWWCNSAWNDYYERSPEEIYLSTPCVRVDADGSVRAFNDVKLLTIDTAWGELPEQFPDEVVPHLKRALHYRPDAVPPVVWVYPFEEYHRYVFDRTDRMPEAMSGDLFVQQAMNEGLPLSAVVTTDALAGARRGLFDGSVLVSPVPDADTAWDAAVRAHLDGGGAALLYGPTAHAGAALKARLNLAPSSPLDGELAIEVADDPDRFASGRAAKVCHHDPALSAGGIAEVLADPGETATHVAAWVSRPGGADRRVAALWRALPGGGRIGWVRGTSSVTPAGVRGRRLDTRDPAVSYPCEALARHVLAALGWGMAADRERPGPGSIHWMVSRCRNGFVFAGHATDDAAAFRVRTRLGAPVLPGRTTRIEGGAARWGVWRCFHEEVRVFVEQGDSEVSLHTAQPKHFRYRRRWVLRGLRDATVRFFPERGCYERTNVLLNPNPNHWTVGEPFDGRWVEDPQGRHLEMRGVSGMATFAWAGDDVVEPVAPPA